MVEQPAHFMAVRKQKKKKGLGSHYLLQGHTPSDLTSSH
jgi:hypothetical protein